MAQHRRSDYFYLGTRAVTTDWAIVSSFRKRHRGRHLIDVIDDWNETCGSDRVITVICARSRMSDDIDLITVLSSYSAIYTLVRNNKNNLQLQLQIHLIFDLTIGPQTASMSWRSSE